MSGVLQKAIDEIRAEIPSEILDLIFVEKDIRWRQAQPSVDEQILAKVLRPRVMVDCKLLGGVELFVPLEGLPAEKTNDYTFVYRIPKVMTQDRTILSVLNVTYGDPNRMTNLNTLATGNQSVTLQLGSAMMNAMGPIPMSSNARCQLIGENVVMIKDTTSISPNQYLRCLVANDENMNDMPLVSYLVFAEMCVLAVKAYIYTNHIVKMGEGELSGGQTLGILKDIISNYSESNSLYTIFRKEKWMKVAFMNDTERWNRHLRLRIGGTR